MSRSHVSPELRRLVQERGRRRCAYCLSQELIIGAPMEVDHIVPEADGGETIESNLCLACSPCNDRKNDRTVALDPDTKALVRLFNPNQEVWTEHFSWDETRTRVVGLTPTGRGTLAALSLNRVWLVQARLVWAKAGWHPPKD